MWVTYLSRLRDMWGSGWETGIAGAWNHLDILHSRARRLGWADSKTGRSWTDNPEPTTRAATPAPPRGAGRSEQLGFFTAARLSEGNSSGSHTGLRHLAFGSHRESPPLHAVGQGSPKPADF